MAYKRSVQNGTATDSEMLTAAMVGIGMNFAADPIHNADIEDTLSSASALGMDRDDFRVLALLTDWLEIHHARVNADRLIRIIEASNAERVKTYWAAIATWLSRDRRFARLAKLHTGPRTDLMSAGTDFQIRRHGEDERFQSTVLRVPAGVLRRRSADILPPAALAEIHTTYRQRILMGPSYRADMWATLIMDRSLCTAALARKTAGSFATAWQVRRDFELLSQIEANKGLSPFLVG